MYLIGRFELMRDDAAVYALTTVFMLLKKNVTRQKNVTRLKNKWVDGGFELMRGSGAPSALPTDLSVTYFAVNLTGIHRTYVILITLA
jgi:hypothetical protein